MTARATLGGLVVAIAAAACSDPSSTVRDQLNLDRPVDVSFACYGGLRITNGGEATPDQPTMETAQPTESCRIRSQLSDVGNVPPGQEVLNVGNDPSTVEGYGFILQSVPGTVGIAKFPNKVSSAYMAGDVAVIDADTLTPGKNGITVGSLPVAIATDTRGCHVVTANAGSCDLSVLSINSVLQSTPAPEINRVAVANGAGVPVLAKPAAMLAEPPTGTIGEECPLVPSGLLYVAYPNCHMVAALTADGTIEQAIRFDATGAATILTGAAAANISCPAECGDDRDAPTVGPHPTTIDIVTDERFPDHRRMVIGSEDEPTLTIVELDATYRFGSTFQIPLSGEVGVLDVAISGEIGMGGSLGERNDDTGAGGQFQFVYAVTTDGTVRVADILDERRECDTQIDPRYLHEETSAGVLSCLPIDDPLLPRRPNVRGPGIQLLGDSVPISVRIFAVDNTDTSALSSPSFLVGWFAAIGTSGGAVVFANVDDDFYSDTEDDTEPLKVSIPLAIAHQLRDAIPSRDLLAITTDTEGNQLPLCDTDGPRFDDPEQDAGGPRLKEDPIRFLNTGYIAPEKAYALPSTRSLECIGDDRTKPVSELGFAAPIDVREAAYPDLRSLRKDEEWNLVWEGAVSRDSVTSDVDGPAIRIGQVIVGGTGMRVEDPSHPYCSMGIEPHDIVALRGCDPNAGDSQCPTGFSCYVHPDSQVSSGSCLPVEEIDSLSAPCRDFLISQRTYAVASVDSGVLKLAERPRVLRTTPTTGCTSVAQCDQLYVAEYRLTSDLHPIDDQTLPPERHFSCEADPSRNGDLTGVPLDRCVMTCDPAGDGSDCDAGTVCNDGGRCVEGVAPPLQCVSGLQRYDVRVSDAFAVIGTSTGFQHPIIEDATGKCIKDPAANPLLLGRLPLIAPPCTGDGLTDLLPNPCETTVTHAYYQPLYQPGTCTLGNPAEELMEVPTQAIRFRGPGMTYHLVNPTYPGDATCRGDRQGGLVDVPTTFPGMTITFEQVDGLVPKTTAVTSTFPVRILLGPQNSLWIVDEGDFLSTSTSTASTRGKVFRVESNAISTINTLQ